VSYAFSRSGKRKRGYNISQVDEFLSLAREQYSNTSKSLVSSLDVRNTRFELERNGYSISVVDAALEKLEDVFAANEYSKELLKSGYFEYTEDLTALRELIIDRSSRAKRRKFVRRVWPNRGYDARQVDKFCSQMGSSLEAKTKLTVKDVRTATFKSKRGGYAEYQVDAFLEKVVEVLQREQALQKGNR
jgi:DivIVA domain-containing protein